jgi:hypothetical protein
MRIPLAMGGPTTPLPVPLSAALREQRVATERLRIGYVGSVPDYPYGTKFYIPNVRRYFVVQDTCAECHVTPSGSSTWVDMWTGGNGTNNAGVLACEDAVTGNHTIIRNPDANRAVVPGALYQGTTCTAQFGG